MTYWVKFKQSDNSRITRAKESARVELGRSGAAVVGNDVLIVNNWQTAKSAFEQAAQKDQLFCNVEDLGQAHSGNKHYAGLRGIVFGLDNKPGNCQTVALIDSNPVKKVFYTPFPCMFGDCQKAADERGGYVAVQTGQRQTPPTQPLAAFGWDLIIYVVCHGDSGMAGCDCRKCGSKLDPSTLSAFELQERMLQDGLSKDVRELRLWACKGADAPSPGAMSFVEAWAGFFEKSEYPKVSIYGYTGYLLIANDKKKYSYGVRNDNTTKTPAGQAKRGPIARP